MDIEELQHQVISHPLFQRLQTIVENYPGYHDNETTFDHLIKTAKIASGVTNGYFITNIKAKEKFLALINRKIYGTTFKTIMVLTALLHDCGKLLLYTEGGQTKPLRIE